MLASRLACILDFSGRPGRLNSNNLSIFLGCPVISGGGRDPTIQGLEPFPSALTDRCCKLGPF